MTIRGMGLIMLILLLPLEAAMAGPYRPVVGQDRQHVVQPGENLPDLARHYGVALEHLSWANGLPIQKKAPVGRALTIPLRRVLPANPPRDGLVLNIAERGLYLFRGGRFEKFYPVAVGRSGFHTPTGQFRVISKVVDPTWVPPAWAGLGGVPVPPGPDNPLGDRWIGVTQAGVGIHGTVSPYSIGMTASHGCIRMYPEAVRELFERVWVGMPVRIEYETAKLGRDPVTGEVLLASYPDSYGKSDPLARARNLLRAAGLAAPTALPELVAAHEVRSLDGPPVMVRVEGREVEAPALLQAGGVWLAPPAFSALGLQATWDAASRSVVLADGERTLAVPLDGVAGLNLHGRGYLPASVLGHFGYEHSWDAEGRVLDIRAAESAAQ